MADASDEARVLVLYAGGTIGMLRSAQGGYEPHPNFLFHNLRSQSRFHDEDLSSVFSNSSSISSFDTWSSRPSSRAQSPSPLAPTRIRKLSVQTEKGTRDLPSLVTPKSGMGKRIRYVVLEYEPLIDSAEVEMSDWIRIAGDIERNYKAFDSFVILHGTDTMAYTASALSFLLQDLGKTVILTGSQIPLSQLLNDSIDNLLGALILAGHYPKIPEVGLFFHHKLLRGNRSTKISSGAFEAFDTPGFGPLGKVGIDIDIDWHTILRPSPRPFKAHKTLCPDITTIRITPGISPAVIRALLAPAAGIRGVVLSSYGAGNAPRKKELLEAFREATERGVVVVNVSQCNEGTVEMGIYATGRALAAVGISPGGSMTLECAFAKLAYLLSLPSLTPTQIRHLLSTPLRGELGPSAIPTPSPSLAKLFSHLSPLAPLSLPSDDEGKGDEAIAGLVPAFPASEADVTLLETALLPHLLAQAAAQSSPTGLARLLDANEAQVGAPLLEQALWAAVKGGREGSVSLLVEKGASVHARDEGGHSVLYYAARNQSQAIVDILKGVGAHFSEQEITGGEIGLELAKMDRLIGREAREVWGTALAEGEEARAREALKNLLDAPKR